MAVLDCRTDHETGQPSPEENALGGLMMWYVYCRHLSSGRDDCVNQIFDTPQAAIKHIAKCYAIDKDLGQLGEYYYFMKKH